MTKLSWAATVKLVHERAHFCCEYCKTSQLIIGQSMHVEHIDPAGSDDPGNLCLSCPSCNFSKARVTEAADPETGDIVTLFNPRQQEWEEHFQWLENGVSVGGKTACGRATIQRLKMNKERLTTARKLWVRTGAHPPKLPSD